MNISGLAAGIFPKFEAKTAVMQESGDSFIDETHASFSAAVAGMLHRRAGVAGNALSREIIPDGCSLDELRVTIHADRSCRGLCGKPRRKKPLEDGNDRRSSPRRRGKDK